MPKLGDARPTVWCQKEHFLLILPFSSENVSFLNVSLMKHAILVIGNKAADFILLTNTVSISWKASGENLKVE